MNHNLIIKIQKFNEISKYNKKFNLLSYTLVEIVVKKLEQK